VVGVFAFLTFLLRREVLLRRDLERVVERLLEDLERRLEGLRRDLDRLVVLDLLVRFFDALGFRLLRLGEREADRRVAFRFLLRRTLRERLTLGPLGVRARRVLLREADLLLEAFGVRLLLEVDRLFLAFGALDFLLSARRFLDLRLGLLGDFALRRRDVDRDRLLDFDDFGVRLRRLAFFLEGCLRESFAFVGVRTRFLIPSSLLRLFFISTLYESLSSIYFWQSLVFM